MEAQPKPVSHKNNLFFAAINPHTLISYNRISNKWTESYNKFFAATGYLQTTEINDYNTGRAGHKTHKQSSDNQPLLSRCPDFPGHFI